MRWSWRLIWIKIILIVVGVALLLYFFFEGLKFEILGGAMGTLLAMVGSDFLTSLLLLREEKNKLSTENLPYDRAFYRKRVKIGGGETEIWYDAPVSQGEVRYCVTDDATKQFTLDPVLQANFSAIMKAHCASFIKNPLMIRLDDYEIGQDGTVRLFTSRTAFYNDLVTNRAMDYKFNGEMSVREIFESGRYLTTLSQSKMSNHIGFGAFVFYGNSMLVTRRGGNATLSKKQFTETLAFGFAESELIDAHAISLPESSEPAERFPAVEDADVQTKVLLVRLAKLLSLSIPFVHSLYGEGKIRITPLGFGQLAFMGGKPQFYYAIVIDESTELFQRGKQKASSSKNAIDYNSNVLLVDEIRLVKNGKYALRFRLHGTNSFVKGEAQNSFFINYWHLIVRPKIDGVPKWVYKNATE